MAPPAPPPVGLQPSVVEPKATPDGLLYPKAFLLPGYRGCPEAVGGLPGVIGVAVLGFGNGQSWHVLWALALCIKGAYDVAYG